MIEDGKEINDMRASNGSFCCFWLGFRSVIPIHTILQPVSSIRAHKTQRKTGFLTYV